MCVSSSCPKDKNIVQVINDRILASCEKEKARGSEKEQVRRKGGRERMREKGMRRVRDIVR